MSGIIAAAGITAAAGLAGAGMQMIGGKGSGGTQTQTAQQTLPGWVDTAASQNYQDAYRVSQSLGNPYSGSRVANMTPQMQELIGQLYNNVGATNPGFDQASGITNGLTGFNPSMINPQTLAGANLSPYMSPYTQSIIDPTMKLMEQSRQQALGQIGDQATQNRAFGGSRQGISEGVTNAQSELQKGQFGAGLYQQNFLNAQQAATGDISRNLQAQQLNQAAGEWGAGFQGQMANQLASLAAGRQQNYLAGVQPAMAGQQMLNAQDQAQLDAARQYYEEQRQYPLQQIQIRQNALAQSPYGQGSVQTGPGPSTNPLLTGLGTAATTAGLLGTFGKMGGFGSGVDYGGSGSGLANNPASGYAQNAWFNSLAGSGLT